MAAAEEDDLQSTEPRPRRCTATKAARAPRPVRTRSRSGSSSSPSCREQALHAGQRGGGRAPARPRASCSPASASSYLLDPGSFDELDLLARHRAHGFGIEENRPLTDGVITGWGTVDGRKVFVFSQDFTVFGGALGEVFAEKIHKVMDLAESVGAPLDRPQRRRRRPHPGRRRLARQLRRHLLPQRAGVGRHPADQRDPRAVRRRRGVLARR